MLRFEPLAASKYEFFVCTVSTTPTLLRGGACLCMYNYDVEYVVEWRIIR